MIFFQGLHYSRNRVTRYYPIRDSCRDSSRENSNTHFRFHRRFSHRSISTPVSEITVSEHRFLIGLSWTFRILARTRFIINRVPIPDASNALQRLTRLSKMIKQRKRKTKKFLMNNFTIFSIFSNFAIFRTFRTFRSFWTFSEFFQTKIVNNKIATILTVIIWCLFIFNQCNIGWITPY